MLFLVHQSIKSLAIAHSSRLSGAVLKDSCVSGIRTDPKWTAGRKQSGCDWILANMTAMITQYILQPNAGGIWAITRGYGEHEEICLTIREGSVSAMG